MTPEQEVIQLIERSVGRLPVVPATAEELEAELLKGLESPGIEMTPEMWERESRELAERHRRAFHDRRLGGTPKPPG